MAKRAKGRPLTAAEARHWEFRNMLESELQSRVLELARLHGWRCHAERPARTAKGWRTPIQGDAGFPDLVFLRDRPEPHTVDCIVAELKRHGGKPTPEQETWLGIWNRVPGIRVFLWRPDDLESGAIEEALA